MASTLYKFALKPLAQLIDAVYNTQLHDPLTLTWLPLYSGIVVLILITKTETAANLGGGPKFLERSPTRSPINLF